MQANTEWQGFFFRFSFLISRKFLFSFLTHGKRVLSYIPTKGCHSAMLWKTLNVVNVVDSWFTLWLYFANSGVSFRRTVVFSDVWRFCFQLGNMEDAQKWTVLIFYQPSVSCKIWRLFGFNNGQIICCLWLSYAVGKRNLKYSFTIITIQGEIWAALFCDCLCAVLQTCHCLPVPNNLKGFV